MGISSNQARFLALTSRQIDLEHRIQQICQRRLRLTSELENVATSYNNKISNRQMYAMNTTNGGVSQMKVATAMPSDLISSLMDSAGNTIKDSNGKAYVVIAIENDHHGTGSTSYEPVYFNTATNILAVGATGWISTSELGLASNASQSQMLDAALRAGMITIAAQKDEFTQSPIYINNEAAKAYELKDWRTLPAIADELYKGDDVDAENKYDKTVEEINAQDKKLQLEQTTIEVEYKAITSEKESVKKILDTNAQASFKYFS